MTRPETAPHRVPVPGLFAVLLLTAAVALRDRFWNLDDAMIVFRVVRNLLDGHGWAFNPGETHNPVTSVLNVVLTAALTPIAPSVPDAGHLLGAAGIALAGSMLLLLLHPIAGPFVATAGALALVHVLARNDTWGLETHLFSGLALTAVLMWQRRWNPWFVLGLIVLTRPDGVLLVLLTVVADTWRSRRVPWRGLLQCGVVIAPWVAYSLAVFGQVFPDTLSAKIWQGQSGYWGSGRLYLTALKAQVPRQPGWPMVVAVAAVAGAAHLLWRPQALLLIVAFAAVQQAIYVVLNVPGYHWYFAVFQAAVVIAAAWTGASLAGLSRLAHSRTARIGVLALVAWCGWQVVSTAWGGDRRRDIRHEVYTRAIETIDRTTRDPGSLATLEVGSIGFGTPRPIVDLTGLASANPEFISGRHLDTFFSDPPRYVLLHDPPWHFEIALVDDPRFPLLYGGMRTLPDAHFPMMLHERPADRHQVTQADIDASIAATFLAPERLPDGAYRGAVQLTGSCALDHVNGRLPAGPRHAAPRGPVRLRGWAVNPVQDAIGPETLVVFEHDSGVRWGLTAGRTPRRDIAGMYPGRTFEQAGYLASARTDALPPGPYALSIVMRDVDGGLSTCRLATTLDLR